MRPVLPALTACVLALLIPLDADAKRRHHHHHRHVRKPPPPPARVLVRPVVRVAVRSVVRLAAQPCPGPGSVWVSGHPGQGGVWIPGHCATVGAPPRDGYVYVSGYWNGRVWVSGFWRPQVRVGYAWVDAHVNDRDEYIAGYWEPEGENPEGMMWRPGYFDGDDWVAGGWVHTETYSAYDENGELVFFAVGDGHVEELAIPDSSFDGAALGPTDTGDLAAESAVTTQPEQPLERHASVPD